MRYFVAVCHGKIHGFSRNRLTAFLEAEEAIGAQYLNQFPIEIRDVSETQYIAVCDGLRDWNEVALLDASKAEGKEAKSSEAGAGTT